MKCPTCKADNPDTAANCSFCGAGLGNLYAAPMSLPGEPNASIGQDSGGDETVATIIPYKNPGALIAYYLGLFSCFPLLGLPMAIAAIVLAIKGFKAVRRNPSAHGTAHAWVGIICGTIGLLINLMFYAMLVIGLVAASQRR